MGTHGMARRWKWNCKCNWYEGGLCDDTKVFFLHFQRIFRVDHSYLHVLCVMIWAFFRESSQVYDDLRPRGTPLIVVCRGRDLEASATDEKL